MPPTEARMPPSTFAAASSAQPQSSNPNCDQAGYAFTGLQIYTGQYSYVARTSSMPHGDTDRAVITAGHRTWNDTVNPCSYPT